MIVLVLIIALTNLSAHYSLMIVNQRQWNSFAGIYDDIPVLDVCDYSRQLL